MLPMLRIQIVTVKKPKLLKTKNGRINLSSNCAACGSKKSRFIKEQETSRLLSCLGIRTTLNQIPSIAPPLF